MQTGLEKVLKLGNGLIQVGSKLDFKPGSLLDGFLEKTPSYLRFIRSRSSKVRKRWDFCIIREWAMM